MCCTTQLGSFFKLWMLHSWPALKCTSARVCGSPSTVKLVWSRLHAMPCPPSGGGGVLQSSQKCVTLSESDSVTGRGLVLVQWGCTAGTTASCRTALGWFMSHWCLLTAEAPTAQQPGTGQLYSRYACLAQTGHRACKTACRIRPSDSASARSQPTMLTTLQISAWSTYQEEACSSCSVNVSPTYCQSHPLAEQSSVVLDR
jgi:hypothetical protein